MSFKIWSSCFWLFVPILVWNAVFYKKLPEAYQKEDWDRIPKPLDMAETILRVLLFAIPLLLTFETGNQLRLRTNVVGWSLYFGGMLVYFLAWLFEIYWPDTMWSKSRMGFMAPTYTSGLWLAGILLLSNDTWHTGILLPVYTAAIVGFEFVHTLHSFLVLANLNKDMQVQGKNG